MKVLEEDQALQLEVALVLLPLIGRCSEIRDGLEVSRANRLQDAEDRRLLVREVTRRWLEQERTPGEGRTANITAFVNDYVEEVESEQPNTDDYRWLGYDTAMEQLWRRHVAAIRRSGDLSHRRLSPS
ncbi:hypothetical protein ACQP00_01575 [Dactylosporangium sp. CS-047395]|uniref:hypothetical protein n=1 Tax=Dactylosporangium sp. CS-047395 TaxID=3239936 RepID=UPI003D8B281E